MAISRCTEPPTRCSRVSRSSTLRRRCRRTPPQQPQQGLIQVNGLEGARAYPLGPNSAVPLFDANSDVMYVKRTDAGGYPTIQAYTFAPVQDTPQQQPEYVTRQEFNELKEMIANGKQPVRKAAKPAADESAE